MIKNAFYSMFTKALFVLKLFDKKARVNFKIDATDWFTHKNNILPNTLR